MNEQQLIVARELADHPSFTWRKGLLPVYECAPYVWRHERVEEDGWNPQYCDDIAMPDGWPDVKREAWPDLTDAGTGGVLWEMAGRPGVESEDGRVWVFVKDQSLDSDGDTLGEACARLWLRQQAKAVVADSATTGVAPRGATLKLYYANHDLPFHEQPFSELSAASAEELAQDQANLAHCAIDWVVEDSGGEVLDSGTAERWVVP